MKVFIALAAAALLVTACDKESFETKPRIEVRAADPDVVDIGQNLNLTLRFFDKEGDVDDSLYIIRKRTNIRDENPRNPLTLKFGIPKFPDKTQGDMDVALEYARHLTVLNSEIPLPGSQYEPDTLSLRFYVRDAAGNVSDTVTLDKNIIVIR